MVSIQFVASMQLSPDARVFGDVAELLGHTIFGGQHTKGYLVEVFDVGSLKLTGEVRLPASSDPVSVSIDHRDGIVTVLSYDGHQWRLDHP